MRKSFQNYLYQITLLLVLNFIYSCIYVVIFHCGFNWHFLIIKKLSIFSISLLAIWIFSFVNYLVVSCTHLAYILMYRNSLCILDTGPLCIIGANMFSYHVTCLFTLLVVFSDKLKSLILLKSIVSFFPLWLVFFVLLNKSLPTSRSQNVFTVIFGMLDCFTFYI